MSFDVGRFLRDAGVVFNKKEYPYKGKPCIKFELAECLFDSSHTKNDACIFQYETGVAYKCQHNSCKEKKWQDVRDLYAFNTEIDFKKYWTASSVNSSTADRRDMKFMSFEEIYHKKIEFDWIINGMILANDPILIHALGGVGKSMFVVYIAMVLASLDESEPLNTIWADFLIPRQRATLFIQSENGCAALHDRIHTICRHNPSFKSGLKNIFTLSTYDDTTASGLQFSEPAFRDDIVKRVKTLEQEIEKKIDVIVIDPMISFLEADENDAIQTRAALDNIKDVGIRLNATLIIIHHDKKDGSNYRGSTAINDFVRSRISLTQEWASENVLNQGDDGVIKEIERKIPQIKVKHEKSNNFNPFESFTVRMGRNLQFRRISEQDNISPENQEKCNKVTQALKDMGGFAESMSALAKVYSDSEGLTPKTGARHINIAVKFGAIQKEAVQKGMGRPFISFYCRIMNSNLKTQNLNLKRQSIMFCHYYNSA